MHNCTFLPGPNTLAGCPQNQVNSTSLHVINLNQHMQVFVVSAVVCFVVFSVSLLQWFCQDHSGPRRDSMAILLCNRGEGTVET